MYLRLYENGFYINSEGVLEQRTESSSAWDPGFTYESVVKLTKLSDVTTVDSGTLIVNGPISVEEYAHLCIWEVTYSHGNGKIVEITAPYGDGHIALRLEIRDVITPGTFQYAQNVNGHLVGIDLTSTTSAYWDVVGSDALHPSSATIEIIEYSDTKMSGTYSFVGQDAGLYKGEFEVFFNREHF